MKLGLYSIYDKMTGYMVPSYQQNDEQAARAFAFDVNSSDMSLLKVNPEDFQLERVGYFDTDTGEIEPCKPVVICTAVMVKEVINTIKLTKKDGE